MTSTSASLRSLGRTGWSTLLNLLLYIWLPVGLLLLWVAGSAGSRSPFFPPLTKILIQLESLWSDGTIPEQLVYSLSSLGMGYGAAALIGLIGGVALWWFPAADRAARPLLFFLYALPAIAVLPALIAIFGTGQPRQVAFIALGALWPTLFNTMDGLRSVDSVKLDTATAMHLSRWQTQKWVVFPAALPQIVAGLRASLQIAIILMIVSELVGSDRGIGYFILQSQSNFAITNMWTGILVLAMLGLVLNVVFVLIESRVLRWHYRSRALERTR